MTPQGEGRYGGVSAAELEQFLRDPTLPPTERDLISDELARRWADGLVNSAGGVFPRAPAPPPSPPLPPPRGGSGGPRGTAQPEPRQPPPQPGAPGGTPGPTTHWPQQPSPTVRNTVTEKRHGHKRSIRSLVFLIVAVVIVAAVAASQLGHGASGGGNSTSGGSTSSSSTGDSSTDETGGGGGITTYATECDIPDLPQQYCWLQQTEAVGAACSCEDPNTGLIYNGTAQ